ncbi:MAG TPA: DUF2092 domain-containing protein [Dehalococcoidia bacterium]|nr:DUF2092 domain-containing protein [Dehalococcoidia bacterium]
MKGLADRWFIAAALVVVLLGGGMAAYLVTQTGGQPASVRDLQSYHIEAVVTSSSSSRNQLVRIWYQAPDRLRVEAGYDGSAPSVYVVDGDTMHVYNAGNNTYYDQPKPPNVLQARGNTTMALGPLPNDTLAAYFDAQPGGTWGISGRDKVLGKDTEVVERDLRTVAQGTLTRYWIDPHYLFVLRYESTTPAGKSTWQPTSVEYNAKIDPQLFVFTPPAGARPAQSQQSSPLPSQSQGGGQPPAMTYALPPGFLKPSYLPAGYVPAAVSQSVTSGGAGNTSKITVRFNGPSSGGGSTPSLSVEQTRGASQTGAQEPSPGSTQVDVNGAAAYEYTADGVRIVSWQTQPRAASAGESVVLRSADLSFDELLKVARSMR